MDPEDPDSDPDHFQNRIISSFYLFRHMNNIFEKISLILILLKILFHIYLCHYFATNNKIAITHLWHAMELQTICHLIAKDKVAE